MRPGAYVFRLHDTGEVIQRFSLSEEHERLHGAPYTQLHRADLHDILAGAGAGIRSRRGAARTTSVVELYRERATGVELHFADGTSVRGDLLIGADGLKSVVRRQLLGDTPATYTGDAAWRLLVPANACRRSCWNRSCRCSWAAAAMSSAITCAAARC